MLTSLHYENAVRMCRFLRYLPHVLYWDSDQFTLIVQLSFTYVMCIANLFAWRWFVCNWRVKLAYPRRDCIVLKQSGRIVCWDNAAQILACDKVHRLCSSWWSITMLSLCSYNCQCRWLMTFDHGVFVNSCYLLLSISYVHIQLWPLVWSISSHIGLCTLAAYREELLPLLPPLGWLLINVQSDMMRKTFGIFNCITIGSSEHVMFIICAQIYSYWNNTLICVNWHSWKACVEYMGWHIQLSVDHNNSWKHLNLLLMHYGARHVSMCVVRVFMSIVHFSDQAESVLCFIRFIRLPLCVLHWCFQISVLVGVYGDSTVLEDSLLLTLRQDLLICDSISSAF